MSTLKALINSLTDFEFLSSISSVDFHLKKIFFKKHFWNTLIKHITKNVDIHSDRDLFAVISAIKKMCFTRLGLVSPHSMKRFFLRNIPIVFEAFEHRIKSFFRVKKQNVKNEQPKKLSEDEKHALKKEKKKEARRRNRNNRRQRKEEQKLVLISNDEQSGESEEETEDTKEDDKGYIEFGTMSNLRAISGISTDDLNYLEEHHPEYYQELNESRRVLLHVLAAHLEPEEDQEEEEEEEESSESEESESEEEE